MADPQDLQKLPPDVPKTSVGEQKNNYVVVEKKKPYLFAGILLVIAAGILIFIVNSTSKVAEGTRNTVTYAVDKTKDAFTPGDQSVTHLNSGETKLDQK